MAPGLDEFDVLLEIVLSLVRVSLIKPCFAFIMFLWLIFRLNVFYCYSC